MSGRPFRFLHASDLHLELPLHGLAEVPEHLRDRFLDAPYAAARKLFELALSEDVEFVVLAGDVLNIQAAGPHSLDLLLSQLQRLHDHKIDVFWAGGRVDQPTSWPAAAPLPPNVHLFAEAETIAYSARQDLGTVASIVGSSNPSAEIIRADNYHPEAGQFTVGVAYGPCDPGELKQRGIDYWALGGKHNSSTPLQNPTVAHYCGSCQGRNSAEAGPHGCTLVSVDGSGRIHRQLIPVDAVRWQNEILELPDTMTEDQLLRLLRDQCRAVAIQSEADQVTIVSWLLTDSDQLTDTHSDLLAARLRSGGLDEDILRSLREEFGSQQPCVWAASIEAEPPSVLPAGWYEEDTVLGDLLRQVQSLQRDPDKPFQVEVDDSEAAVFNELRTVLRISSTEERNQILKRVASLGVDLLRGDRVLSHEELPAQASYSTQNWKSV